MVRLAVTFVIVPTGPDCGFTESIVVDACVLGRNETVMKTAVIMRIKRANCWILLRLVLFNVFPRASYLRCEHLLR